MARNYKKKGSYKSHKPEVIEAALSAVRSKLMTVRQAGKEFGIPPTTLHNWVKGKVRKISLSDDDPDCKHLLYGTLRIKILRSFFF